MLSRLILCVDCQVVPSLRVNFLGKALALPVFFATKKAKQRASIAK